MARFSVTIPDPLREDVDYISQRMGVTRSALISELLAGSVPDLRSLVEMLPEDGTEPDMVRLRGASADIVRSRLQELQEGDNDFLSDL